MSTVWAVTKGEYSEYHVVALYATEDLAKPVAEFVGGEVEEWDVVTAPETLWVSVGMRAYKTQDGWINEGKEEFRRQRAGPVERVSVSAQPSFMWNEAGDYVQYQGFWATGTADECRKALQDRVAKAKAEEAGL